MDQTEHLQQEISKREAQLASLRAQLAAAQAETRATPDHQRPHARATGEAGSTAWPLDDDEYQRYGRQMIVPGFGLQAQLRLKQSRVLVVGAGGLGCPAAAYLAGAGVGVLGLADGDVVELSNLHRQIGHATARVGMPKVLSAVAWLRGLNPAIAYASHGEPLTAQNAEAVVSQYDVVLDCTDHPASRYLVSDACVLLGKPLVSASALQTSGQLMVLNNPPGSGPCYRCIFPRPPPPASVVGCGEGGILGPVVGLMGVLQALEALTLLAAASAAAAARWPRMLLLSAPPDAGPSFRSVGLRGRRADCLACSGRLTRQRLRSSMDYARFCGLASPVALLAADERLTPVALRDRCAAARPPHHALVVDVRECEHFSLGSIPSAVNIPIRRFSRPDDLAACLQPLVQHAGPIYVVCRVGNDSQLVVGQLKDLGLDKGGTRFIGDLVGGLRAWKDTIDPSLPFI